VATTEGMRALDPYPETLMRGVIIWLIEQACRPFDTIVCEIANETDEPYYYR
jgi:hypothetical protein